MKIAVLGPGVDSPSDPGLQKRQQIRRELAEDGYSPFFPEDDGLLVPEYPLEPLLYQQRRLLSHPDVQLIIVLYTSTCVGAGFELGNIMAIPELKAKTAVLFPIEYYHPDDNLAANTVRDFLIKFPYTDKHFEICQLVSECRVWAKNRETAFWPGITPFMT